MLDIALSGSDDSDLTQSANGAMPPITINGQLFMDLGIVPKDLEELMEGTNGGLAKILQTLQTTPIAGSTGTELSPLNDTQIEGLLTLRHLISQLEGVFNNSIFTVQR